MRPLDVGLSSSAPTKQQVVCSGALGLGPKGRAARQAFFPEALGRRTTYTCLQKRQQTPPWPPVSALRAAVTAVESRGREPSPGGEAGSGQGPLPGRSGGGVCPFIPAAGDCCALARVRPSAGLWGPRAPPEWVAARTAWAARRSGPPPRTARPQSGARNAYPTASLALILCTHRLFTTHDLFQGLSLLGECSLSIRSFREGV